MRIDAEEGDGANLATWVRTIDQTLAVRLAQEGDAPAKRELTVHRLWD